MTETPRCAQVRELIPELAAGVADGDERARALAHLARCLHCRNELAAAATVVDELVLLAPEREPSAGFETGVLAALATGRTRRRRLPVLALRAAAVLVVVALTAALASGLAWRRSADDRELAARYRETLAVANGRYLTAADLTTPAGAEAGHLFAYQGSPSWVFVTVTAAPQDVTYRLRVVTDAGTFAAGSCVVKGGAGTCGSAVPTSIPAIQRVELVRPGASTLTARLD